MNELAKILIKLGFNKVEAEIYLILIEFRQLTLTEISKRINVKRTTCYQYVDELLRKNIIYRVPQGKRFSYQCIEPGKLFSRFKGFFAEFEDKVPELNELYNKSSSQTKVSFHGGKNGIKEIYNESFLTVGNAYSIFPADEYFNKFTFEEFTENEKLIKDTKFKSKDLIISDKYYKKIDSYLKELDNDSKSYKKLSGNFNTSVDVLIYGNKTALITLKNLTAIVIDNQEIAELFKLIHNHLWKNGN